MRIVTCGLSVVFGVALSAVPAIAARSALDTRAPDLIAPVAHTLPQGQNEIELGLGAAFGPNAPMAASLPVTPVPQAVWLHGISDRSDLLVGLFGPGASLLGRFNLLPEHLNLEAGLQTYLFPQLVVAPLAELQCDLSLGPMTLHLVPALQPEFGARQQLTAFGVAGLEWPISATWDVSASLKGTYGTGQAFDLAPAAGVRCTFSEQLAVEGLALVQRGAPAAMLYGGQRF